MIDYVHLTFSRNVESDQFCYAVQSIEIFVKNIVSIIPFRVLTYLLYYCLQITEKNIRNTAKFVYYAMQFRKDRIADIAAV